MYANSENNKDENCIEPDMNAELIEDDIESLNDEQIEDRITIHLGPLKQQAANKTKLMQQLVLSISTTTSAPTTSSPVS